MRAFMSFTTAPIALFVYNRPAHTRETVLALQSNGLAQDSDLFVFSDGAKSRLADADVAEVRSYVRSLSGFRSITVSERPGNAGLARSIIEGVSSVCNQRQRVIVVEDDLVTSPWFLEYMNRGLEVYEHDEQVASIHGYCYPVRSAMPETFFLRGADCWGWATWSRAWRHFDPDGAALLHALIRSGLEREFDLGGAFGFTDMLRAQVAGVNESWAVRWHASCFLKDMLTLYPGRSLVRNIGNDSSGTHSQSTELFTPLPNDRRIHVERIPLEESQQSRLAVAEFLRGTKKSFGRRVFALIARRMGFTVSART
jgi:hypothetical protein